MVNRIQESKSTLDMMIRRANKSATEMPFGVKISLCFISFSNLERHLAFCAGGNETWFCFDCGVFFWGWWSRGGFYSESRQYPSSLLSTEYMHHRKMALQEIGHHFVGANRAFVLGRKKSANSLSQAGLFLFLLLLKPQFFFWVHISLL